MTVAVNVHPLTLPPVAATVTVTGVVPAGKELPDEGFELNKTMFPRCRRPARQSSRVARAVQHGGSSAALTLLPVACYAFALAGLRELGDVHVTVLGCGAVRLVVCSVSKT